MRIKHFTNTILSKSVATCLYFLVSYSAVFAQLTVAQNTQFVTRGGVHLIIDDLDYFNDGSVDGTASTFHFTGNNNTTLFGGTSNGFTNMQVAKATGKQLVLQSPILVTTDLTFVSGNLELDGHDVSLGTSGKLVGESETSRITGINGGEVQTQAVLASPNSVNVGNLGAFISSTQNLGVVVIRRGHKSTAIGATGTSIQRYFTIIPTNDVGLNATLKILYFDAEKNGLNESIFTQFRSANNVTFTNQNFSARDAGANFVTKAEYSTLNGRFTLSEGGINAPLPVTFVQVRAECKTDFIHLFWQTATEQNSDRFDIQRSTNGSGWQTIGIVPAAGNSNSLRSYGYDDKTLNANFAFYRLAQYDRDGKVAYSSVVKAGCAASSLFTVMPNPVGSVARIVVGATQGSKGSLVLYDATGRAVIKRDVTINNGINQYELDVSTFSKGVYQLILLQDGRARQSVNVIKQ